LRGLDSHRRIRRLQGQAAERSLDVAAQLVVQADRGGAVGNAVDRRAGRGVDDLAVGLFDIDFLGVRIGHQPFVLQRADDGVGERIGAGGERVDGFFRIGKLVVCEFGDRVFERSRQDRQHGGENQQDCKWERAEVSEDIGKH
jgi:hypothetical protein